MNKRLLFFLLFFSVQFHNLSFLDSSERSNIGSTPFRPFIPFSQLGHLSLFQTVFLFPNLAMYQEAILNRPIQAPMQNYRGRAGEKKFAITFDMGDKIGQLPHILEVLAKYNNRATFFMTGQFLLRYPEWSRRVVAGGHEVGNHTFHHRFIKQAGELKTELLMTESTFYQVTGKIIAPYWRSPYFQEEGHDKKWLIAEAHRLGYLHFNATIDSKDWTNERHACFIRGKDFLQGFKKLDLSKLPGDRRFSFCKGTLKYLKKNQRFDVSGGILLMHASSLRKGEFLTQQLGPMMSYLQKNGYKLVTLTELIN